MLSFILKERSYQDEGSVAFLLRTECLLEVQTMTCWILRTGMHLYVSKPWSLFPSVRLLQSKVRSFRASVWAVYMSVVYCRFSLLYIYVWKWDTRLMSVYLSQLYTSWGNFIKLCMDVMPRDVSARLNVLNRVSISNTNKMAAWIFLKAISLQDRLCRLMVRVSGYRCRCAKFDSRPYQIFWEGGPERGPFSLVRTKVWHYLRW
jgi:hypothetical protein